LNVLPIIGSLGPAAGPGAQHRSTGLSQPTIA
jgi:hypothetical protein